MATACGQVVAEPEREGHLARLEGLQAELRVGVDAHDGLGVLRGERLDLHAPRGEPMSRMRRATRSRTAAR